MARFSQGMHVQSWVDPSSAATIASWMLGERMGVASISALIAQSLDTLAEVIVANGHRAIVDQQEIEEIFLRLFHGKRATGSRGLVHGLGSAAGAAAPVSDLITAQAREIYAKEVASRKLKQNGQSDLDRKAFVANRRPTIAPGDEIEILPSIADDGEFSPEMMREEEDGQ